MERLATFPVAGRVALIGMTGRHDGDLSWQQGPDAVLAARESLAPGSAQLWTQPRQIHSDRVIPVAGPGDNDRAVGDALVTTADDAVLAIQVADCVPIALVNPAGALGVVHAGWRGAVQGVIESAVRSLRTVLPRVEATTFPIQAVIGPHICASCYAFGADDLRVLQARFGPSVVATTDNGEPALDMTAVVTSELKRLEVDVVGVVNGCTAHDADRWWSHRARHEPQRQILVATMTPDVARWSEVFAGGW